MPSKAYPSKRRRGHYGRNDQIKIRYRTLAATYDAARRRNGAGVYLRPYECLWESPTHSGRHWHIFRAQPPFGAQGWARQWLDSETELGTRVSHHLRQENSGQRVVSGLAAVERRIQQGRFAA